MKKKVKKKYEKPAVTKVRLEAKVSVLGACKASYSAGPSQAPCDATGPCNSIYS